MLDDVILEVDKGNDKSQKFICSECKAIFREVGCLSDIQTGEEKPQEPLSNTTREVPPECSPQLGAPQEPPCQDEEKPQELSSSSLVRK